MERVPIFDIHPNFNKIKGSLGWGNVRERTAVIGISRQLHQLLHNFSPDLIDDRPGPCRQKVVEEAFSKYIAHNKVILINPVQPGICQARAIPELRALLGRDSLPFSQLAVSIKRHLVLLDIID
jgi:hypothetical protein